MELARCPRAKHDRGCVTWADRHNPAKESASISKSLTNDPHQRDLRSDTRCALPRGQMTIVIPQSASWTRRPFRDNRASALPRDFSWHLSSSAFPPKEHTWKPDSTFPPFSFCVLGSSFSSGAGQDQEN